MTTREQARRRPGETARADVSRPASNAAPVASLPERLLAARERKGVDLFRAERDTKIRASYLAALERGDWRELPGSVYTKGFLRNYALYLGLDPDEILLQWRSERGDDRPSEPVIVVPRPIQAPARGFTFSPGILVVLLLIVGVIAFAAYLGLQLLRFAKPPVIAVTDPATAVSEVDDSTNRYTLRGTSTAGSASVDRHAGPGPHPDDCLARRHMDRRRGPPPRPQPVRHHRDRPGDGKQAEQPVRVFITVPFSVVQAPTLTVDQPGDGITVENGAIPVQGTATNATTVTISASYVGPAPAAAATRASPSGSGTGSGGAFASPAATPRPPLAPPAQTLPVAEDGSFGTGVELTTGKWTITVTAASAQNKTTTLTRQVTVQFKGVNLVVAIEGGPAWIKVWVDGKVEDSIGQAGKTFAPGKTLTFTAQNSIEVRTGDSGATHFTLNGTSLGALGRDGIPETWLFAPPAPPQKTGRT